MNGSTKSLQDQIQELHKLVDDALEKLDQVVRGLDSLEQRVVREEAGEAAARP